MLDLDQVVGQLEAARAAVSIQPHSQVRAVQCTFVCVLGHAAAQLEAACGFNK